MQTILISVFCILASLSNSLCRNYDYGITWRMTTNYCTEDAVRENIEMTTCANNLNEYDYIEHECSSIKNVINKTITCINTNINYLQIYKESVEDKYPYPLTLKVTQSNIPVLPTSAFKNLNNVTILVLENIKLNKIMPGAFNFLARLKEIYLGNNELTIISDGIFNSLTLLEKVDLSRNFIDKITNHAFVGISLHYLNLNKNNISGLGYGFFNTLTQFSVLDISENKLKSIHRFHNLRVQNLNLSHNRIDAVDFEEFEGASSIDISFNNITKMINFNLSTATTIILSHNKLRVIEKNNNVHELDISHNSIKTIDNNLFDDRLIRLYISFNFISSLTNNTFLGLKRLMYLYLDNNNISSLPNSCFKDLVHLTYLNLSGNKLEYITFGMFDNLYSLEILDISNNNFKKLPQLSLHSLGKLQSLFIQNNEISDIETDYLKAHLQNLREIDLKNNVWSCEKLIHIVHFLDRQNIHFHYGDSWTESNVFGIKCHETFQNLKTKNIFSLSEISLNNSELSNFFNEDFTKTILYKYFNQDFKQTEFFKYLESLSKTSDYNKTQNVDNDKLLQEIKSNLKNIYGDFGGSKMYNYFNKDFKNSSFVSYLENFKSQAENINKWEKLNDDKMEQIITLFKTIATELEANTKTDQLDFEKSTMYKYFNKDFKTSNFYRYLESLNRTNSIEQYSERISDSEIAQLISPFEKITNGLDYPNYTGLLSFIAILLLIIICMIAMVAYHQFFRINKYSLPNKEVVELI